MRGRKENAADGVACPGARAQRTIVPGDPVRARRGVTVYGVEALRRVPGGIASREIAGGEGGGAEGGGELASGSEDTRTSGIVPRMTATPEEVPVGVHQHRRAVVPEDIDELGHVNNLRYLEWMMAAAIEHSEAVGWDGARYAALGNAWVVRSHAIEYLRPAFAGDAVVVRTWVSEMAKVSSRRKYAISREAGPVLARAETLWVYINRRTHTLDRVPTDLRAAFTLVPDPVL